MPLWKQDRYGHAKWGYLHIPAQFENLRKVWSNPHPWLKRLGYQPYSRSAEWHVYTVDPATLANVDVLPRVAGGNRESSWEDEPIQRESLTLTFMNPDEYLPGGTYHALVEPGRLLRVEWTARALGASQLVQCGLYRVTSAPQPSLDGEGPKEPQAEAEGWLEDPLRRLMLDGANPLGDCVKLRDSLLPLGLPIVWSADSYATLAAALIYAAAGHRLRVPAPWRTLNYWGTSAPQGVPPPPAPEPLPPDQAVIASVQALPEHATRGQSQPFTFSWAVSGLVPSGEDALFWFQDGLSTAQASAAAAGEPADSIYLLRTGGQPDGTRTVTLAPDFGVGRNMRTWYWNPTHGAVESYSDLIFLDEP